MGRTAKAMSGADLVMDPRKSGVSRSGSVNVISGSSALVLLLIWACWLMMLLALGLIGLPLGSPQWIGEVAVLANVGVTAFVMIRFYRGKLALILVLSLALRVSLLFWDLNFRDFLALPNSGADSEVFFAHAVAISKDPSLVLGATGGGAFSKVFGLLFWLTGVHRAVAQYTNVLLGISLVVIVEATMRNLPMDSSRRLQVLVGAALLPNTLVMSAIFLRESLIAFLIALSVYFFVRWMRGGSAFHIVLALMAVLAASAFHAGVISVAVGYMAVAVFYRRGVGKFGFSLQSLLYLTLFAAVIWLVVSQHPDIFLGKFEAIDSEEDLLTSTNRRAGGSQYLTGLTVDSYSDMALSGPLRATYFLGSPMPWDARGAVDLVTFLTDSLFYLAAPLFFLVVQKRLTREQRILGYAILVVIVMASLVFGAGVSNAGTAVRHRSKLVALFVLLWALVPSRSQREGRRAQATFATNAAKRSGRSAGAQPPSSNRQEPVLLDQVKEQP